MEGPCATAHVAASCASAVAEPEVDDIAKHVDIADEVANMSQTRATHVEANPVHGHCHR